MEADSVNETHAAITQLHTFFQIQTEFFPLVSMSFVVWLKSLRKRQMENSHAVKTRQQNTVREIATINSCIPQPGIDVPVPLKEPLTQT